MKLELKHLAPYLPYDLEVLKTNEENKKIKMRSLKKINNAIYINEIYVHTKKFKPILRPLSDLKSCCDIYEMIQEYASGDLRWVIVGDLGEITYSTMQLLLQHHFDVFGLISKGLAIDINTLNK